MENFKSFRNIDLKLKNPLFKYYREYKYVEDCIVNSRIHLETPDQYNDIYDSSFVINFEDLKLLQNTPENLFLMLKRCLHRDDKDKIQFEDYKDDFLKCRNMQDTFNIVVTKYKDVINVESLKISMCQLIPLGKPVQAFNNKISCFSETPLSIPMWAYYANSHKGVCLMFEFDSNDEVRKNIHKVIYSDFYYPNNQGFANYFVKSRQWEHEQEWRVVCDTNEDYLNIKAKISIILGYRNNTDFNLPYYELAGKYKLDLYQIKMSNNSFNLQLDKILDKGIPIDIS